MKTEDEAGKKGISSLRERIFFVVAAVIVSSLVFLVTKLADRPSEGVIVPARQPIVLPEPNQSVMEFYGKRISFRYPSGYESRTVDVDTVSLEKGSFFRSGDHPMIITYTVRKLPSGSLFDIPDYRFRHDTNPERYMETNAGLAAGEVTIFTRTEDGYEKTAFFAKDRLGIILSVSATSSADPKLVEDDFKMILESIGVH